MNVVSVPRGREAPDDADWVQIDRLPAGAFQYTASVAVSPAEAIFASGPFATVDAAKEAGLSWAEQQGAATVHLVDRTGGTHAATP